jgi:YVTN family beta-propeller protein
MTRVGKDAATSWEELGKSARVRISLAGPILVEADELVVDESRFPGRQARLVFAYLVSEHARPVPRDELADAIWGETPPPTWEKALIGVVSKLRTLLAECGLEEIARITSAFGCYQLHLPEGSWIDLEALSDALQAADRAFEAGDFSEARSGAEYAAMLARRPFLSGEEGLWVESKRRELLALRVHALDRLTDASLEAGDAGDAVKWAGEAVELEPLREAGYQRLMRAHAAADNQAEALRTFERCRKRLAEELGAHPSAATQAIHLEILRGRFADTESTPVLRGRETPVAPEPPVDTSRPTTRGGEQRRMRLWRQTVLLAGAGLVVAAVVATLAQVTGGSPSGPDRISPNSLGAIDPVSSRIDTDIPVGARPGALAFGSGSLWVANLDDRTISRVDPETHAVLRTIPVGDSPLDVTTAAGAVWSVSTVPATESVTVRRIDPSFDAIVKTIRVASFPHGSASVAAGRGSIWVVPSLGLLTRLNAVSNRPTAEIDVASSPTSVAVGPDAVWIADTFADTVTRVDPTGALSPIPVGHGPAAVALGAGAVWVVDALDDSLVRIDPETRAVTTTIPVGHSPVAVAVGAGAVWVANGRDGTISKIDPRRLVVVKTIAVGGRPARLLFAAGRLWVTVQDSVLAGAGAASVREGGVAHVSSQTDLDSLDPPLAYLFTSWQLEYATCAKLLNYPDRPAPQGSRLEPEVAQALPRRSADGKTYTFTIRNGFRFSPPSNAPVTAETFKYTIERTLDPRMNSPARLFATDIAGEPAYEARRTAHISGVVAGVNRLTIKLVRPSGDLPARLAMAFFCAVPVGTPVDPHGLHVIPSAGPYYVASYEPGQGAVLKRNPNYAGGRPHRLAEIDLTTGVGRAQTVAQIEAGTADYALDGVPPSADATLAHRFGPASAAAKAGHQRYFANPLLLTYFLALNTSRPLFANVHMRRAVNYAIDRTALARLGIVSNRFPSKPSDQYLPPGIPGFRDVHIYPLTPNVDRARSFARGRGRDAVLYTCNSVPCAQSAQIIKTDLDAIGLDVEVRAFPLEVLFGKVATRKEPFDLATVGWGADYPDPADFLNLLLDGHSIRARGNVNYAYFDDPQYNHELEAAARLAGPKRYQAYAGLDVELARNAAPWVAVANPTNRDFFSPRMGCEVYQPVYGIDLAALCIRR